jgi:aminoglycoside phosphotransferase (APT) family kinase protein
VRPANEAASPATAQGDDGQAEVVAWIEREIGPVLRIERQSRWRPAWFVQAQADGRPLELYVRGSRGANWPQMPLSYEARIQQLFEAEGVKVAHVFGFIEDVPAIVMQRVRGRPNMATAASDADRDRLREQLADQMLKIHQINPGHVEALGAPHPKDARELTLSYHRQIEQVYLAGDRLPAPDLEFGRRWFERNAPPCAEGPAVVTVDAGQFIFEGDQLTSMVDFELVTVGDRHVDFAALRTRDRFEKIGDLEEFYEIYRKRGGIALDRKRILFHRVGFCMATPLQIADELAHPESAAEYFEYFKWHVLSMSDVLKDIAHYMDVSLPSFPLPEPAPTQNGMLLEALTRVVGGLPEADDPYGRFRRFNLGVAVGYLADYEKHRSSFEAQYFADVETLLGRRPVDQWDADVQMQEFIKHSGPEHELSILNILHRRNEFFLRLIENHHSRDNQTPWNKD